MARCMFNVSDAQAAGLNKSIAVTWGRAWLQSCSSLLQIGNWVDQAFRLGQGEIATVVRGFQQVQISLPNA